MQSRLGQNSVDSIKPQLPGPIIGQQGFDDEVTSHNSSNIYYNKVLLHINQPFFPDVRIIVKTTLTLC